jgi:hypothetical protein
MSELSDPAIAVLVQAGRDLKGSDLKAMLMRVGLFSRLPEKTGIAEESRAELIRTRLLAGRADARKGDTSAHRGMLAFATELLQEKVKNPKYAPDWFSELQGALLADGYQITWDGDAPRNVPLPGDVHVAIRGSVRYSILPADAAPVTLTAEINGLEAELAARGYTSALNHYRQAVDGFINRKYESANGDLRTTLEDLVTRLAEDHTGYQRQQRASQGGAAIRHLIQHSDLDDDNGGMLLSGLWKLSHTNGSHPGQSDADEARFRMQVITATARFLLRHFPAAS